jgi:stage II sporulation protein D
VSAVNVLPIEDYLTSVVDSEMPGKFPEAARMAQAIVARTYALYQIRQADPNSQYDLLASQRSQKYLGYEYLDASDRRLAGESPGSRRAVNSTRGMVYQYDGKLFCTYYSAACGGQTTNGQQVFKDASDSLASVPCEWCSKSPFYRWTRDMPLDDFQQRIWDQGNVPQEEIKITQLVEPGTGAITQFELDNGRNVKKLSGIELRDRLPSGLLLSPQFTIKLDADRVIFEGRGYGHGVGFCQWGAKGQADAGRNCFEIVRFYYPGSKRHIMMY